MLPAIPGAVPNGSRRPPTCDGGMGVDFLSSSGGEADNVVDQLEAHIRERNNRFRLENDALRHDNLRLRRLREATEAAMATRTENDLLRHELGKLASCSKRRSRNGAA